MQIIVQNENEKELLETFFNGFLSDPNYEQRFRLEENGMSSINSDEFRLIKSSFKNIVITIDPAIEEMHFNKDDILSQIFECSGFNDEQNNVTYSQYLNKQSQQLFKPWEHDACWNEQIQE
ncbi:hypothetical protein [Alkalihalobacillus sp. BA299]|uniref:hypothetical protein n=1 Tax=Alkalihalobacillus sp. BA299 TaxID=2815938 RepID=UPI001AD9985A|nr:hypothetical protein [Alkalihalobacillus sp. BA299]